MIDAYWYAGARAAHEGQSVYSKRGGGTRIGDRIARDRASTSSPTPRTTAWPAPAVRDGRDVRQRPQSVFDNGLPLDRTDWIRDGELTSLLQTRHSAAMTGQPVTPAIDNLVLSVDGGSGTVDDLVAGTERGLLLTCLWYIREVDPQTLLLTGLTRDGVYLVENGEITGAVNNFRWNESPVDLLRRFTHASGDGAELQPRVGRRLLLANGDAGAAGARLQHVERLPGPLSACSLAASGAASSARPSPRAPAARASSSAARSSSRTSRTPQVTELSPAASAEAAISSRSGRLITVS